MNYVKWKLTVMPIPPKQPLLHQTREGHHLFALTQLYEI